MRAARKTFINNIQEKKKSSDDGFCQVSSRSHEKGHPRSPIEGFTTMFHWQRTYSTAYLWELTVPPKARGSFEHDAGQQEAKLLEVPVL